MCAKPDFSRPFTRPKFPIMVEEPRGRAYISNSTRKLFLYVHSNYASRRVSKAPRRKAPYIADLNIPFACATYDVAVPEMCA